MIHKEEGGQALPLVCLFIAAAGAALLLVAQLGVNASQRAQARTAADAAALAGAAGGRAAAVSVAEANGARLLVYGSERGGQVKVVARVGDAEAEARAEKKEVVEGGGLAAVCAGKRPPRLCTTPYSVEAKR